MEESLTEYLTLNSDTQKKEDRGREREKSERERTESRAANNAKLNSFYNACTTHEYVVSPVLRLKGFLTLTIISIKLLKLTTIPRELYDHGITALKIKTR